jgi:hypothetical protein
MIGSYFLIAIRVFGAWFIYIFRLKALHPKLYYSSIYLFSKQSFRLPQSAKSDFFIVFKSYVNTLRTIFQDSPEIKKTSGGNIAVLDSTIKGADVRANYLSIFGVKPDLFLARESLSGSFSFGQKLLGFFLVTKLFSFFWSGSFSRNRAAYALLLRESVEWINLLTILKRNKITELYMFCIYEKDSNMLAHLLMKRKIKVNKITSEVPLTFANKIIVADKIILCFNYQKEELKAYKKTMFYTETETWLPEAQGAYLHLYNNKSFEIPQQVIGFYSSAFWLRKKLNHSIADVGSYDAEEEVLKYVSEYLVLNPNLKLVIFTHPYEKKTEELWNDTLTYYKSVLSPQIMTRVEITEKGISSTHAFNKVNIGISVFSTIMFERINLGFKTILTPIDKTDFPLVNSPFRNICAYSKEELFMKLDKNLPLNKSEFFTRNDIENYISDKTNINYNLI